MACFSSGNTAITRVGRGREFYAKACELSFKGIVSKRADAPYTPGDRGLWVKTKCSHRQKFIVIGWTDPEGVRRWLGSLLLGYCCRIQISDLDG
jgi:bifunctional non-homologous end joining protein LigD